MSPDTHAMRCRVTGRVQGVAFRANARREALALGLTGRARNLPDGSVEIVACGPRDALDAFAAWLSHGPALARVTDVERQPCEPIAGAGFGVE